MNCAIGTTFRDRVGRLLACGLRRVLRSNSEGSALVEMAFAAPFMMLMITGMASFGLCLNNYLMLSHAVDVGARVIAVNQGNFTGSGNNPCAMAASQIQAAAQTLDASQISYSITISPTVGGTGTTFTSSNGAGDFGSGSSCDTAGAGDMGTGGGMVTVEASYPFLLIIYGWTPSSLLVQAQSTDVIQ